MNMYELSYLRLTESAFSFLDFLCIIEDILQLIYEELVLIPSFEVLHNVNIALIRLDLHSINLIQSNHCLKL